MVLAVSSPLPSDVNFYHTFICSFLAAAGSNPLVTTQLDASNMYIYVCPIETPHPPVLEIIYN